MAGCKLFFITTFLALAAKLSNGSFNIIFEIIIIAYFTNSNKEIVFVLSKGME